MDLDKNGRILSRGLANIHHVNDTTMVQTPSLFYLILGLVVCDPLGGGGTS